MSTRRLMAVLCLWASAVVAAAAAPLSAVAPSSEQVLPNGQPLLVLCYHDVAPALVPGADPLTVDSATLAAHLNWLRSEKYVAIDLQTLVDAYAGTARLPERAVLLTFDDGYESAYTQVFPLLRAFAMPAVVALVGQWMQTPSQLTVRYGESDVPRDHFISWDQAREMQASGLVEFASHSWDLHHGIEGDPAGSVEPAATTHAYLRDAGYESDRAWRERVRSDLERNSVLLAERLGRRPRAIVWPYGRYNAQAEQIASDLGMPIGFTLDSGRRSERAPISRIRRLLIDGNPAPGRFAHLVRAHDDAPTVRFVQVNLDRLPAPGSAGFEPGLNRLLEHIRALGVETVVLQAFAQPARSGRIEAVYFPNRQLPMRADLLNPVAWRIATSTQARVYASMPLEGFALDPMPEDPDAQLRVGELFEDLGKAAYFQGLLLGGSRAGAPLEQTSARAATLASRSRAWQPQLRTALRLQVDREVPLSTQVAVALRDHEYLVIERGASDSASSDADVAAAVASIQGAAPRTIVAIPAPPGSAAHANARAQALLRAGLPNLGVIDLDLDGSATELATLTSALSLRSRLAQATGVTGP